MASFNALSTPHKRVIRRGEKFVFVPSFKEVEDDDEKEEQEEEEEDDDDDDDDDEGGEDGNGRIANVIEYP